MDIIVISMHKMSVKVCIFFELKKFISLTGMGTSYRNQIEALKIAGINYTTSPKDNFDIIHFNFYGLNHFFQV